MDTSFLWIIILLNAPLGLKANLINFNQVTNVKTTQFGRKPNNKNEIYKKAFSTVILHIQKRL